MSNYTHLRIARPITNGDNLPVRVEAICSQNVSADMDGAVYLPVKKNAREHQLHGRLRYRTVKSLALPIIDLIKPETEGYRGVFAHAAMRFDDGSRTKVAQVSKKISALWAERFKIIDQNHIPIESSEITTNFTYSGCTLSAVVQDGDRFKADYDVIQDFFGYMASMKQHREKKFNFSPDSTFRPLIPLVHFDKEVSDDEIIAVCEEIENEFSMHDPGFLPIQFQAGSIMPPKIY